MISATTIILDYVCPIFGIILANIMFSAPYKSVTEATLKGTLGVLNPTPWAFMTGNCAGWVTYSFLKQDIFVFFGNAPGFIISLWLNMCAAKLQYQDHMATHMRSSFVNFVRDNRSSLLVIPADTADDGVDTTNNTDNDDNDKSSPSTDQPLQQSHDVESTITNGDGTHHHQNQSSSSSSSPPPPTPLQTMTDVAKLILHITTQETQAPAPHEKIVMIIVTTWMIIISLVSFLPLAPSQREFTIGLTVNINLFFFYGAPLSSIVTVMKRRNSVYIHKWTMMTNTINGAFWAAYGFSIWDLFIFVPNGLGVVLGVVQMILIGVFPPRSELGRNEEEEEEKEEVMMSEMMRVVRDDGQEEEEENRE